MRGLRLLIVKFIQRLAWIFENVSAFLLSGALFFAAEHILIESIERSLPCLCLIWNQIAGSAKLSTSQRTSSSSSL